MTCGLTTKWIQLPGHGLSESGSAKTTIDSLSAILLNLLVVLNSTMATEAGHKRFMTGKVTFIEN